MFDYNSYSTNVLLVNNLAFWYLMTCKQAMDIMFKYQEHLCFAFSPAKFYWLGEFGVCHSVRPQQSLINSYTFGNEFNSPCFETRKQVGGDC